MGKGYLKRMKTKFKSGHTLSPRTGRALNNRTDVQYVRLEPKMQNMVLEETVLPEATTDSQILSERDAKCTLLRSMPNTSQTAESQTNESRQSRYSYYIFSKLHKQYFLCTFFHENVRNYEHF